MIREIISDNYHEYELTKNGWRVQPHSGRWVAYAYLGKFCRMVRMTQAFGHSPKVLTIPIRTWEKIRDIERS